MDESTFVNIQNIKVKSKSDSGKTAWSRNLTPEKRLKALNKQFADLNLDDFVRKYTDRSKQCVYKEPSKSEIEKIFADMKKIPVRKSILIVAVVDTIHAVIWQLQYLTV